MSTDFRSARHWAREIIGEALIDGGVAIDATMGNGHDTLWLCEMVGEKGRVYAFDVQKQALENTQRRLDEARLSERASLFLAGHERMAEYVHCNVDAVVFNLGWLPGGEKRITTRTETTISAVSSAARLLKPSGVLTICIYPGHAEGMREKEALLDWAARLTPMTYDVFLKAYINQPNDPPLLIAVRRRP